MVRTGVSGDDMKTVEERKKDIARETMAMNCVFARVFAGMDHVLAAEILGEKVGKGCVCQEIRVNRHEEEGNNGGEL